MSENEDPKAGAEAARIAVAPAAIQLPKAGQTAPPAAVRGASPNLGAGAMQFTSHTLEDEQPKPQKKAPPRFAPAQARSWEEIGYEPALAEDLTLRTLQAMGVGTGRQIAEQVCIALPLMKQVMDRLKGAKLINYRGTNAIGDYICELTEMGNKRAAESREVTSYVGPAPVEYEQYLKSVKLQSLRLRHVGPKELQAAFKDLSVSEDMLERLGPAVSACKAMFLFGEPGNGKTSLAERMTRCFGDAIWIPYTLIIGGQLVKFYDPAIHEMLPLSKDLEPYKDRLDSRWAYVKRPTVIAGGELTLDMLELKLDELTKVSEAPLQMKANCGTLVIDDFGRGHTAPQDLLNRWIFPLEKQIDFLRLPDGRKFSCPFDALLVFSTNLEPRDLADEAFLRRIPYKIHVGDPDEEEFKELVELIANKMGIRLMPHSVKYLVDRHYKMNKRPFRFCHPRDLLQQVLHLCRYQDREPVAGPPEWDKVTSNYFGLL